MDNRATNEKHHRTGPTARADELIATPVEHRLHLGGDGRADGGDTPSGGDRHIGIWAPTADGSYCRDPAFVDEWPLWADIPQIPAKSTERRIVLIGESVARGYLYDPEFTPAQVLEDMLSATSIGSVDVVDLARTSLDGRDMAELIGRCTALEPDAIVIFAGNNWYHPGQINVGTEETVRCKADLEAGGAAAFRDRLLARLRAAIAHNVETLRAVTARTAVLWLLPEFNLADWQPERAGDVPWLRGSDNVEWARQVSQARRALERDAVSEVLAHGHRIIELDGGTSWTGHWLCAQAHLGLGNTDKARTCLEQARDAHLWDSAAETPRITAVAQQTLRDRLPAAGVELVDIAALFQERWPTEIAGRRQFLDYCHLTSEGIAEVMAACAERLAGLFGAPVPARRLHANVSTPPGPVEAQASFGAAIHAAHRGQPVDQIRHYLDRALEHDPEIARAMRLFADLQVRPAPSWMCPERQDLAAFPVLDRYLNDGAPKLADMPLRRQIDEALRAAGQPGPNDADLLRARSLRAGETQDLLDIWQADSYYDRSFGDGRSYAHRIFGRERSFLFQLDRPADLMLRLTARSEMVDARLRILVNGAATNEIELSSEWNGGHLRLPRDATRSGENQLHILWMGELRSGNIGLARAAALLPFDLHELAPVFGELYELTLSHGPSGPGP